MVGQALAAELGTEVVATTRAKRAVARSVEHVPSLVDLRLPGPDHRGGFERPDPHAGALRSRPTMREGTT